ncbi:MAG: hypothetical protein FH752_14860 [Marinobacter adhaerens]|uniref:Uncharacterized protein n=1 Tax=Marinobacter adhaerens TaxID=1033846 RepID=A0A844I290_9GAMM|nr:hypothetical protein [Marinobacter adhaerens]
MEDRPELAGWRWGPFTFRVPFYHTRLCWSEFLQGLFVSSRGTVVLIGAALAFFEPWMGLLIGVVATLALVGWDRSPDPIPHDE